jgi:DNA repair exonuclease SbcCD ATPase subunit
MKLKKIAFKNIASYGEDLVELEFSDNGGLYLVQGVSGSGKTTISNVIKLGLYGKAGNRIKKADIANRTNKNGYIYICVEVDGKNVEIERWFSPSKEPRLVIDGINKSAELQSDKREIDTFIENEILQFPFVVFDNLLTLTKKDFDTFVKMSKKSKQEIFDRVFGFFLLNDMNAILSAKLRETKTKIANIEGNIESSRKSMSSTMAKLDELKVTLSVTQTERFELLKSELKSLEIREAELVEKLNKLQLVEREYSEKLNSLTADFYKYDELYKSAKRKIHLYQSDKCPTCGSDLRTPEHKDQLLACEAEVEINKLLLNNVNESLAKVSGNLEKIERALSKFKSSHSEVLYELKSTKEKLNSNESVNSAQMDSLTSLIDELERHIEKKSLQLAAYQHASYLSSVMSEILSERGVKREMIRNILPELNSEIEAISELFSFEYSIVFDEEFNTTIMQLGDVISPETLSGGESTKADIICLIATIKLMRMKYPSVNFIFLDEVLGTLDDNSRDVALGIIKDFKSEFNMNAFVINHSHLPNHLFDHMILVEKENNFTKLSVVEC